MIAGKVSSEKMSEYNDDAYKNYNEKALMACPNCARTFLPDRLEVHLKSCKNSKGVIGKSSTSPTRKAQEEEKKSSPSKGPAFIQKPKTLVCYIW